MSRRTDLWEEPKIVDIFFQRLDENPKLKEALEFSRSETDDPGGGFSESSIIEACFELVFEATDTGPILHYIVVTLDAATMKLNIGRALVSVDLEERDAKRQMALAILGRIPIYPQNSESVPELERVYRELVQGGFEAKDGSSYKKLQIASPVTPSLAEAIGEEFDIAASGSQPIEQVIAEARRVVRENELAETERILARLSGAVATLRETLAAKNVVEADLQGVLKTFPILFGLQYRRVLPEFWLGSEYRADFVLERVSGFVDPIELEPSTFPLYTTAGNPSAKLTHAEQQVLDWLDWYEVHSEYARSHLPGLMRPRGIVVIGRRVSLSDRTTRSLARRNTALRDSLTVMTYDDLLDEAQNMLDVLREGAGNPE